MRNPSGTNYFQNPTNEYVGMCNSAFREFPGLRPSSTVRHTPGIAVVVGPMHIRLFFLILILPRLNLGWPLMPLMPPDATDE